MIMGNMILPKHLEHIWPSTHRWGTEFQVKVWNAMKKSLGARPEPIPKLRFKSTANSARAVANACGQTYPPIVPCHRVVRSDGGLGGYSGVGGVETKRRLLSEEGVSITSRSND